MWYSNASIRSYIQTPLPNLLPINEDNIYNANNLPYGSISSFLVKIMPLER